MSLHHLEGASCPLCEEKLAEAHPELVKWYRKKVKAFKPEAHISCSYRGEADQAQAVQEGKSRLAFPHSPHNKTGPDGKPEARALDLFVLEGGLARFPSLWYTAIAATAVMAKDPILWGGTWKKLGDLDHFQLEVT